MCAVIYEQKKERLSCYMVLNTLRLNRLQRINVLNAENREGAGLPILTGWENCKGTGFFLFADAVFPPTPQLAEVEAVTRDEYHQCGERVLMLHVGLRRQ